MRGWLSAFGLFVALVAAGCSGVSVPPVFNQTATPLATQVPLPTRVAIAVPTVPNLIPAGDNSEAAQMLQDFYQAIAQGDVSGAMSLWDTSQPGQPSGYETNVRKMVQGWVDKKSQFGLGDISYTGPDGTGKYVPMPLSDPRVERATAKVKIDGVDYQFFLVQLKGGWFIGGVNTTK
jgi:hypothetical protein